MRNSIIATGYSRPIQSLFAAPPRAGSAQSIFRRAINIILDSVEATTCTMNAPSCPLRAEVISLVSEELPPMPQGIQLSRADMTWLQAALQPGTRVWIGENRLLAPACDCALILPDIPPWEPRPAVEGARWNPASCASHAQMLARYLTAHAPVEGLARLVRPLLLAETIEETPLTRMAEPKLRLLALASKTLDLEGVKEATRGLAGLGPGLTPSGDDTLCGFAAVMALLSPYLSPDGILRQEIAHIIAATAQSRTTKLSATLLWHAARGEVAGHLGDALLALPGDTPEKVLQAAGRLLAFGATSGGDTLLGILLGLRVLDSYIPSDKTAC